MRKILIFTIVNFCLYHYSFASPITVTSSSFKDYFLSEFENNKDSLIDSKFYTYLENAIYNAEFPSREFYKKELEAHLTIKERIDLNMLISLHFEKNQDLNLLKLFLSKTGDLPYIVEFIGTRGTLNKSQLELVSEMFVLYIYKTINKVNKEYIFENIYKDFDCKKMLMFLSKSRGKLESIKLRNQIYRFLLVYPSIAILPPSAKAKKAFTVWYDKNIKLND